MSPSLRVARFWVVLVTDNATSSVLYVVGGCLLVSAKASSNCLVARDDVAGIPHASSTAYFHDVAELTTDSIGSITSFHRSWKNDLHTMLLDPTRDFDIGLPRERLHANLPFHQNCHIRFVHVHSSR